MKEVMEDLFRWKIVVPAIFVLVAAAALVYREFIYHAYKMYRLLKLLDPGQFSEEERRNGVRVIVESCMNVKQGETVLLIIQNDRKRKIIGQYVEREIRSLGAIPTVIMVEPDEMMAEPPARVTDAMMENRVILAALGLNQVPGVRAYKGSEHRHR